MPTAFDALAEADALAEQIMSPPSRCVPCTLTLASNINQIMRTGCLCVHTHCPSTEMEANYISRLSASYRALCESELKKIAWKSWYQDAYKYSIAPSKLANSANTSVHEDTSPHFSANLSNSPTVIQPQTVSRGTSGVMHSVRSFPVLHSLVKFYC